MLELSEHREFALEESADFFSGLPMSPAICLIEPKESAATALLIRTQNLRKRLERLLGPLDPSSRRLNLREFARAIRFRSVGSKFEQTLAYYQNAKSRFAGRYKDLLRLKPPAILKVSLRNAYPRCYTTRRIFLDETGMPTAGAYYGPFASRRSAEGFAEAALDLFKVRRCQIKIRRDPSFPGCLYSEMKMCLAPCFAGCSKEEYAAEVDRLVEFLDTAGGSARAALQDEREQASEAMDFERAAAIHKRVEKIAEVFRGGTEFSRRVQDINAVVLQRGVEEQSIAMFAVRAGRIQDPSYLRFGEMASQPRSAEQFIRDYLEGPVEAVAVREMPDLAEHLWLLARWYYSNPREGEIIFWNKEWSYRKILRACSRILAPPVKEEQATAGAKVIVTTTSAQAKESHDKRGQ